MQLNHERSFFENRRNCSPSELHGGGLFRTFNSYSFNFNSGLRKRRTGYCLLRTPSPRGLQFLWFLKIDLLRFHRIYLHFDWSTLLFFLMCLIRINLPNVSKNSKYEAFWCSGFQWMSRWRSDKFLLTLSVYGQILIQSKSTKLTWILLFQDYFNTLGGTFKLHTVCSHHWVYANAVTMPFFIHGVHLQ